MAREITIPMDPLQAQTLLVLEQTKAAGYPDPHPYAVGKELAARGNTDTLSATYRNLDKMEQQGLVKASDEREAFSPSHRGNGLEITEKGEIMGDEEVERIEEYLYELKMVRENYGR